MTDESLRNGIEGILRYATDYKVDFNTPETGAIDKIVQVCKQYHKEKKDV